MRKRQKHKVYSYFQDNIWGADLTDIQLMNMYIKGIWFLLCAIDVFSKYAQVIPINGKKGENKDFKRLRKIHL